MSYSAAWKQFEKIMSEKELIKTAADKEKDYHIVPPSAGENMPVEETGYELTEMAHPEQVQVALSQLNDGIIENGVEAQKVMIEVALRNPRGVLAELMSVLVKSANALEEKMTPSTLKAAAEIDVLLEKLAQQSFYSPDAQYEALISTSQAVEKEFSNLRFDTLGVGGDKEQAIINAFIAKLRYYLGMTKGLVSGEQKNQWARTLAAIVRTEGQKVVDALSSARKAWTLNPFSAGAPQEAFRAWNDLAELVNSIPPIGEAGAATQPTTPTEERKPSITTIPSVKPEHMKTQPATHHYSVGGPGSGDAENKVRELQRLLGGLDVDGKFGKDTWGAVMNEATNNPNLQELLHEAPMYTKDYQNWNENAVDHAILKIKEFRQTKSQPQTQSQRPFDPYEIVEDKPAPTQPYSDIREV